MSFKISLGFRGRIASDCDVQHLTEPDGSDRGTVKFRKMQRTHSFYITQILMVIR